MYQQNRNQAINYLNLMQPTAINPQQQQKWMQRQIQKSKGRLYVTWRNNKGADCKMIGPQTKCFCDHRFKQHNYLQNTNKKIKCKTLKCICQQFYYIPTHGAYDFKCLCKHSYKQHDAVTKKCKRPQCNNCNNKFSSTWTCSCGLKFHDHSTVVETYEQRKNNNKQTGDMQRLLNQFEDMHKEGGLLNPNLNQNIQKKMEKKQIIYQQYKPIIQMPIQKHAEQVKQIRKKNQLSKLNKQLIIKEEGSKKQEIQQQIEQINGQKQVSVYELYNKPHQYKKVMVDIKKLKL